MKNGWILLILIWVGLDAWLARWWFLLHRERRAEAYILDAARQYAVDPVLVKAVVWRESRFREDARGTSGEVGLMQVGAMAAEEWARAEKVAGFQHLDLLDGRRNTLAGTWYLAKLLRRYPRADRPEAFALADYNAGRANVLRWLAGAGATNSEVFLGQMDFPGTRDYVRAILERRDDYRAQGWPPREGRSGTTDWAASRRSAP